jgi:hypothetical protein
MTINIQQVLDKVKQIGATTHDRQAHLAELRDTARQMLAEWSSRPDELAHKVEQAARVDANLRCALPLGDPLVAGTEEPALTTAVTLLAADGSQVLPDRHAAVLYSMVNVGAIAMQPGTGKTPEIFIDSSLLHADELYTETGMLSGEVIEQRRDIAERRKLLELAPSLPPPLVALTDGPMELWGYRDGADNEYKRNLDSHKVILSRLNDLDVTVAGYVDKPGADLLVRALEVAAWSGEGGVGSLRRFHPLRGVSDRWLFSTLPPGQRSAVFGLQSSARQHYTGSLALRFFYLNVGDAGHPYLARVEIPAWVAQADEKLALLHAALLQQCRLMGARPYPYLLHRAHEIARVSLQEKQQVEQLLEIELRRAGGEVGESSAKQSAKDLPGRQRP